MSCFVVVFLFPVISVTNKQGPPVSDSSKYVVQKKKHRHLYIITAITAFSLSELCFPQEHLITVILK